MKIENRTVVNLKNETGHPASITNITHTLIYRTGVRGEDFWCQRVQVNGPGRPRDITCLSESFYQQCRAHMMPVQYEGSLELIDKFVYRNKYPGTLKSARAMVRKHLVEFEDYFQSKVKHQIYRPLSPKSRMRYVFLTEQGAEKLQGVMQEAAPFAHRTSNEPGLGLTTGQDAHLTSYQAIQIINYWLRYPFPGRVATQQTIQAFKQEGMRMPSVEELLAKRNQSA